jgi:allophanate hydrolase
MSTNDLPFDIASLHRAYKTGTSPVEVVSECFRRIREADDPGIFIHLLNENAARVEAETLDRANLDALPLWGIPFVIKDNIDAGGSPTTAACPAFEYTADNDAFVVRRLRDAGAILIGKTNLDQFATGLVGVRSPFPPPRNAVDPTIVPGGSSSGSAVAVARGLVSFSLGTDTAGSGRVPAALNNIVGLKPTLGAFSASGVVPACRTLDTVSVFALTVEDAYKVFQAAAVYDALDAYSRPIGAPDLAPLPAHFCIGVPNAATLEFFGDEHQAKSFAAAVRSLEALGGEVIDIDFTLFYQVAQMLYEGAWVAERYTVVEELLRKNPEALHPITRKIISLAEKFSAADAFLGIYRLESLKQRLKPTIDAVDLLCVPSIPTFYSLDDLAQDPLGPNARLGTYTNFVNLLNLCGIAVPISPRADGRPGSVTILAKSERDGQAAALAAVLHRQSKVTLGATGWACPDVPDTAADINDDEILLAAVGAHMSGLPLNKELTRLGARFIKISKTAASYRLYRLAGEAPLRPGLMRHSDGASINLEIWALPANNFGAFLRGIPAPLGIGTVTLENGESVNGFICEASGLDGAQDITVFGGWRTFLETQ